MHIVYMGTPEYAVVILEKVLQESDIDVDLVLSQPDRPVGRKRVLTAPPVKELAVAHNIEVLQPQSLKDEEVVSQIKQHNPDFIIVAAYGQLLPKEVLDIAPCINLHASILPLYRGASPIQQALLNGDEYSGVTAMLMEEGLDTGPILGFKYIKTADAPRLDIMTKRLSTMAADLTLEVLKEYENLAPIQQLDAVSSKCKKIKKTDGLANFNSAKVLYAKASAFFGWPGVYLESGLKLHDIELQESTKEYRAGEILGIEGDAIVVGCKSGAVKIHSLQPQSKAKMSAKAYILGKRLSVGDRLL